MTDSLKDIIQKLEHQRTAIDRALTALHQIDGTGVESELTASTAALPAPPKRRVRVE